MAGESGSVTETYTTDEALSSLGFGRFQTLLLAFLGTGWIAEAMEVMLLSFVGPSVKTEWGVSGGEEGLVSSVLFAGMLVGAWLGGLGSDRYGRRAGFLFTALVTGISGFVSAFSPNYSSLLALRFVVGLGLDASHVLPTWFLEFVPVENRGSWMAAFTCCWTLGSILEALLAWVVMPKLGWRWLLALSSSPCFVLLIFFGSIPESPRYLCSRGKTADAMLVLEKIARANNRVLPPGILTSDPKKLVDDASTLLLMPEDSLVVNEDTSSKSSGINTFRALWSADLVWSTFLLWFINLATHIGYYGIVLLTSEISDGEKRCASAGAHMMKPKDSNLYINVLVTSFAEFPDLLLAALLIDRVGRRVSMGWMILLCAAFLSPLAFLIREGLATALLFCARACIMGSFAVLHAYTPEPACMFCDQVLESMQHLSVDCPFTQQVWHDVFHWVRATCAPPRPGSSVLDWWLVASRELPRTMRKGMASLVLLIAWMLWKHRNECTFDRARPCASRLIALIKVEARSWVTAGASGLRLVLPNVHA